MHLLVTHKRYKLKMDVHKPNLKPTIRFKICKPVMLPKINVKIPCVVSRQQMFLKDSGVRTCQSFAYQATYLTSLPGKPLLSLTSLLWHLLLKANFIRSLKFSDFGAREMCFLLSLSPYLLLSISPSLSPSVSLSLFFMLYTQLVNNWCCVWM